MAVPSNLLVKSQSVMLKVLKIMREVIFKGQFGHLNFLHQALWEEAKVYSRETSIHGFRYIAAPSRWSVKVLWVRLLHLSLAGWVCPLEMHNVSRH